MTATDLPLVSVVIPCYNQGRFLDDAVRSALRQTHPALEVIVVDDGSTDDTARVAAARAGVRFVRQQNQGAAVARAAGFRESRGAYIIFLDADDRLLPHAVATGLDYLAAHPDRAFVTGHVRLITEDGLPAGTPPQEHREGDAYRELLRSNYIWTPGVVMYRRAVLDTVGMFDPEAGGSADYELNIRIARRFPIGCHHEVILEYRQHAANMSADAGHMLRSAIRVRRAQRKHVEADRAALEAWQEGIDIVRTDFGGRLIDQVKTDLRMRGRRSAALRGLVRLLRYHPSGALIVLRDGIRRLAGMGSDRGQTLV